MPWASWPADAAPSSEATCSLPVLARTQGRNMCCVVAPVPLVNRQRAFEVLAAIHGMNETLLEVLFRHRFQQCRPTIVQGLDECQRTFNGCLAVCESCPGGLVIGLDGGPIFGKRELEADKGVGVAIGQMMHRLPHGPAALAVGCVELRIAQPAHRRPQLPRE